MSDDPHAWKARIIEIDDALQRYHDRVRELEADNERLRALLREARDSTQYIRMGLPMTRRIDAALAAKGKP